VPLVLDAGRPVKANLSLDAGLLDAIDEAAERRGLNPFGFPCQCRARENRKRRLSMLSRRRP
jgi:hypothetical protein